MKKVDITLSFAASLCIFGWVDRMLCLYFLIALAFHEMGHLLIMKLVDIPVYRIRLSGAGAVIQGGFMGYRQEIVCAVMGPVGSVLLAIACARRLPELSVLSAALAAVNLLPVYPLDGGRIFRGILLLYLEDDRVEKILNRTTAVVCCLLMICACWTAIELQSGIWPIFMVLVILWRVGQAQKGDQY